MAGRKKGQASLEIQPSYKLEASQKPVSTRPPPAEGASEALPPPVPVSGSGGVSTSSSSAGSGSASSAASGAVPLAVAPPGSGSSSSPPPPPESTIVLKGSAASLTRLSLENKIASACVARCSLRTLVMRKWRDSFCVYDRPERLLIFRSLADYTDYLFNPHIPDYDRKFLVKKRVDISYRSKCSPVVSKRYETGRVAYFNVYEIRDVGTVTVCKIGGEEDFLARLRHALNLFIKQEREARERGAAAR